MAQPACGDLPQATSPRLSMSKSFRVSDALFDAAQNAGTDMTRSTAQQVEHWARIGQTLEARRITVLLGIVGSPDCLKSSERGQWQPPNANRIRHRSHALQAIMPFVRLGNIGAGCQGRSQAPVRTAFQPGPQVFCQQQERVEFIQCKRAICHVPTNRSPAINFAACLRGLRCRAVSFGSLRQWTIHSVNRPDRRHRCQP